MQSSRPSITGQDSEIDELLILLQSTFGIQFLTNELTDESTLQDVCTAVRRHLPQSDTHICFTAIVFWRLRKACVEIFGVHKPSITPSAATDLILPPHRRAQAWAKWSKAAGLKFPDLTHCSAFYALLHVISLVPVVALLLFHPADLYTILALPLWIASLLLAAKVTRSWADTLPANIANFGDFAKTVAALNHGELRGQLGLASDSEIDQAVHYFIADNVQADPRALIDGNPRLIDLIQY